MFKIPVEPSLKCRITGFRPTAKVFVQQMPFLGNESQQLHSTSTLRSFF